MTFILVSGLINIETTLRIDGFPIEYFPVRYPFFGVNSTVSGVGYNISKALTRLGSPVRFLSLIGRDPTGRLVDEALRSEGISDEYVLPRLDHTAQSVILYDADGRRQIHVDLKDIQEQVYPFELFRQAMEGCSLAVLCNINFSRPFLNAARQAGLPIAVDVHTISDLEDPYNREFMAAADILFQSDEGLPVPPEEWINRVWDRFGTSIVVVGLGSKGALLGVRDERRIIHQPAIATRPIVNTIGAGDALFSAFIHTYSRTREPYQALYRASLFASYKIGEAGAADGFLTGSQLDELSTRIRAWVDPDQDNDISRG